jgi:hypothetical protein
LFHQTSIPYLSAEILPLSGQLGLKASMKLPIWPPRNENPNICKQMELHSAFAFNWDHIFFPITSVFLWMLNYDQPSHEVN